MNFKNYFVLLITSIAFQLIYAQEQSKVLMSSRVKSGTIQLYYGDLKISYAKAKEISLDAGNTEAFENFKKARRIRSWDIVWSACGGMALGSYIASKNSSSLISGIGFLTIPYIPSRKKRFNLYTRNAIEAYNSGS
jgi:hypothetical protein